MNRRSNLPQVLQGCCPQKLPAVLKWKKPFPIYHTFSYISTLSYISYQLHSTQHVSANLRAISAASTVNLLLTERGCNMLVFFIIIFAVILRLYRNHLYWSWPRDYCPFRSPWSTRWLTWVRAGLCCAAQILWPQENITQLLVAGEPAGSAHRVRAITPPAWPRLCLEVQQEVLVRTSYGIGLLSCKEIIY